MIDDFNKPPERKAPKLDDYRDEPQDTFRTPEVVSHDEISRDESAEKTKPGTPGTEHLFLPPLEHIPEITAHASKPKWKFWPPRKPDFSNITRKQWIIIAAALIVLLGGGTAFALTHHKSAPVAKKTTAKTAAKPAPKPILSPLSGLPVTQEQHDRSVIGVMIENSPDARPQSGLDQASIVFEAIAEAGITRFLALYQDNAPGVIGPVRSARPYYLDFAMTFDAAYAHVGGSPDALQRIKEIGVKDLDQFFNSAAYHRDNNRFAPHNMYSGIDKLRDLATSKGWTSSNFTPLARKAKETPSPAPTAKTVDFAISGPQYNVHYDYDPTKNIYNRSEGGDVHKDNETGLQLMPKVVVALAMPYSMMDDGYHSEYQTTGSGAMIVFQDGLAIPGTWSKAGTKDQFVFKDAAGAELKLNPGQTWFTLVSDISKATYAP